MSLTRRAVIAASALAVFARNLFGKPAATHLVRPGQVLDVLIADVFKRRSESVGPIEETLRGSVLYHRVMRPHASASDRFWPGTPGDFAACTIRFDVADGRVKSWEVGDSESYDAQSLRSVAEATHAILGRHLETYQLPPTSLTVDDTRDALVNRLCWISKVGPPII